MPGKLISVVGGQFGSEAKGHVAGALAARAATYDDGCVAVRVAGPNAGHTAYDIRGNPHALRAIPAMAVTNLNAKLVIAAGSEIQLEVLFDEINRLEDSGIHVRDRLYIDGQATILDETHIGDETARTMHERFGSTGKGVGAARAARIMRTARVWDDLSDAEQGGLDTHDTARVIEQAMSYGDTCIVEGTQGYGLGLHAGYYPYCTSSDCRAIDFYAMAGINPWGPTVQEHEIWVVCRTHPIRVAGNSGQLLNEETWEGLALESGGYIKPERTTVTKKIRRIGRWDPQLAWTAVRANGGPDGAVRIALTFLDYIDPEGANGFELTDKMEEFVGMVEHDTGSQVGFVTTGPNSGLFLNA